MENTVAMEGQLVGTATTVQQSANGIGLSPGAFYTLWIGIIVYMVVLIGIGMWSSRRVKGMNDFLVAGRRLPLWMATATLLATWFGAGSSMGVAATVYSCGIGGVLADPFGASLSLVLSGIFIVGLLRRLKCLTVTDIVERKYGKWAGVYTSLWMIPVYVGWLSAQLLGMGTILHVLTGVDKNIGTMIGAVIVVIYTFAGGMWAVTLTDVVQVSLIVVGLFIIVPGAISEAGGWNAMLSRLSPEDLSLWLQPETLTAATDYVYYTGCGLATGMASLLPCGAIPGALSGIGDLSALTADLSAIDYPTVVTGQVPLVTSDWIYYIGSWIVMGLGCTIGQDLVQRSLASRNEKIAVSSAVMSGFFYAAIGLVPITIGFAARTVLVKYGITDSVMAGDLENQVLPRMAIIILGNLHPLILTVFLAALLSAIMSSADSSLLAGSSLLCNNVIGSIWPRMSDRRLLWFTRVTTIALTVIALFLAMKVESIYKLMINSWASQLVVVFLPVVTALYVPKATKNAAWATMAVATGVWLSYTFINASGTGMTFTELMNSDELDRALTCGAVYGFLAGIVAFLCCYLGERIPHMVLDQPEEEEE